MRSGRRILILASAIVVVDTMFYAALTPLLPEYANDLGLSKAGAGLLQASYPLGVLVGSIPSGYIAARFGVKPTAVLALLLVAATSIVFGTADSIALLDLTRFVQGIGSACAWTAAFAWLIAVVPANRRGQSIGTVLALAIAGAMLGPVLGLLAAVLGTAPVFGAVGLLALAIAAVALASDAPKPGQRQPIARLFEALRNRRIEGGLWLVALPALLFGTLTVLAPLRLDELGVTAVGIGLVFFTAALCEAGLSPVVGRLADLRGKRYPIVIGLLASAVATAVLPWPQAALVVAATTVLAAMAFGIFWAPALALLSDTADHIGLEVAWVFALSSLAWAPGQATGAAVGGLLARATSDAVTYLILSAFCLTTLVAVRRA